MIPPPSPVHSKVVLDIMATPKRLLRAWEGRSAETQKLEEELMSTKIREVEALTELKELRLKVSVKLPVNTREYFFLSCYCRYNSIKRPIFGEGCNK